VDHFNIDDNFFFASLGKGCIKSIDRQSTLTKGKYNLLMDIQCNNGQAVRVVKLFSSENEYRKVLKSDKVHYIFKEIDSIFAIPMSHGAGMKKVLCSNDESSCNITQIAVSTLKAGEIVNVHAHRDMEEFFIIERGELELILDGEIVTAKTGSYIQVPIGIEHSLKAISNVKMIIVGCKK
jgi:quercetin dioxygenase-like cupin family protein